MLKQDKIADALYDMYDIRRMTQVSGFDKSPKDPDGSIFKLADCISNVIGILEDLEENNNE